MRKLLVEVWSDIACPWCYVGKRRLEAALAGMAERAAVEVVWRAFELDRAAPRAQPEGVTYAQRLARKYGTSVEEGQAMIDRMTAVAAGDGLDFRFDRIRPGNTFDAHRLLHLARERGVQGAVKERFLRGYMTEGEPIGDPAALTRMAVEAGLTAADVRRVLGSDGYAREVRDDEEEASRLGIHAVPFFALGRRFAVSGAQPVELLQQALRRAMAEAGPEVVAEGAACGPQGCD
jgi:predicted DsbA family dithiol-disulfide isomerase